MKRRPEANASTNNRACQYKILDDVLNCTKFSSESTSPEAIASAVKAVAPELGDAREQEWEVVRRLVNEYHGQALSQAKVQFWFSVVAAASGFVIIMVAIVMALTQQTAAIQTILQVAPGIAIEAVAALFFRQAAETRERATALYDRLRTDRERSYALSLVETIDNSNIRNAIKAELTLHMAGLSQTHLLPRLIEALDSKSLAPEISIRAALPDGVGLNGPETSRTDALPTKSVEKLT